MPAPLNPLASVFHSCWAAALGGAGVVGWWGLRGGVAGGFFVLPNVDKYRLFVDFICLFADIFVTLYYKKLVFNPFKIYGL